MVAGGGAAVVVVVVVVVGFTTVWKVVGTLVDTGAVVVGAGEVGAGPDDAPSHTLGPGIG